MKDLVGDDKPLNPSTSSGLFPLRGNKKRVAHAHPQNQKPSFHLILRVGMEIHRAGAFYRPKAHRQQEKERFQEENFTGPTTRTVALFCIEAFLVCFPIYHEFLSPDEWSLLLA